MGAAWAEITFVTHRAQGSGPVTGVVPNTRPSDGYCKESVQPQTSSDSRKINRGRGHCLFANRRGLVVAGVPVPLSAASARGSYVVEVNTLRVQIALVRRALGKDRGFDRKAGLSEMFRVVAAHRDRWRASVRAIE